MRALSGVIALAFSKWPFGHPSIFLVLGRVRILFENSWLQHSGSQSLADMGSLKVMLDLRSFLITTSSVELLGIPPLTFSMSVARLADSVQYS